MSAIPVISDDDVRRHVSFPAVLEAVERAFQALHTGQSAVFEVARGAGGGADHYFAVKSGRDGSIPMLGVKAGSYLPHNAQRGLAAHTSTTLLIDDTTGRPVALVEANYLNGWRTAAANALAVQALARSDASTLGIVGIGGQAVFEVLAVAHVRPIRRILAAGRSPDRRRRFEMAVKARLDVAIEFLDIESVCRSADVLVTVTPARQPLVRAEWISPGVHISAMGADDVGKQELDPELVAQARVVVDHPPQAARIGELQHLVRAGRCTTADLARTTMGGLLSGAHQGRESPDDITVFDSSGLAIQDIAAAHAALECVVSGLHSPMFDSD